MDPFRHPGGVPPPPPEPPPPPPPPPEPPGQVILRAHRSRFLLVTIASCLGLSALVVPFSLFLVIGSIFDGGPATVIGERVLELESLDGSRHARFEDVNVHTGEIELHDRGRHVTWRAITPIDTLARDVKKSSHQWL